MRQATAIAPLLMALSCVSSSQAQTTGELWPEIDVYWSTTPRIRLFALARLLYRNPASHSSTQYGLHVDDMSLLSHGFVRLGYRFINTVNDPAHPEQRGILEATVHGIGATRFVNRTRADLRFMDSGFSTRVRDRTRVEHDIVLSGTVVLRPFATAEAFYDSRFGGLARMRYQLGTEAYPLRRFGLDVQYVRQDTYRAARAYVDALSLELVARF